MQGASTRGIVKDGQVVLDEPLDLPDGTPVMVAECESAMPAHVGRPVQLTGEVLAELAAFWRREKTWAEAEQRIRELQARP
jgi:hypothetical protein